MAKTVQLSPRLNWRFIGLVFASALLLYANTLGHGYSLDDDIYTKKNRFIQQGFTSLPDIFLKGSLVGFNNANESNYRPLVLFNFMVDTAIWGNNPQAEHFLNVLLFGLSCVVLLLFLTHLLRQYNPLVALLITLVFVFHPIHTEVVASIKSRDEILGWLFGLLAFYHWVRYLNQTGLRKHLMYCWVFFAMSILCKENGLTFVFVFPLIYYFFYPASWKRIFQASWPFLVIVVVYMLVRSHVLESITFKDKMIVMNNGLVAATSTSDMLATNFVILGKYLWLLVFPVDLTWDYSFAQIPIVGFGDWKALLSVLIYLGFGGLVIWQFKRKNIFAFSILFYLITLFLSSNLVVKIGATMGERFLYVPSLGFCIALVIGVVQALGLKLDAQRWVSKGNVFGLFGLLFLLYGWRTYDRNLDWENNYKLFTSGVKVSTGSARAHFAVASEYRTLGEAETPSVKRTGLLRNAIEEYQLGIAIYKDDPEVYYNLGVTYYDLGDTTNAKLSYQKTLELQPNFSMALNNTGVIYFNQLNYEKAAGYFKRIIATDTTFVDAYSNLGACYHNRSDYKNAAAFYLLALKKNPRNKAIVNNLAVVYRAMGDSVLSQQMLQRAALLH